MQEREQLEAAIGALESQRSIVGDAVTDAALAPLRDRLARLGDSEQSLRQVTVLFMDVVGSTALTRELDPEEIQSIVDGALRRLTAVVEHHHGRVLQYAGDSLLAVFGHAEVREDDPERAVRCAIEMVDEAERIGTEVRSTTGSGDFNIRIGIHTGPVLLGGGVDGVGTIRGIAVNIAARMEQTAPVGGIRISHATQRHVRGGFALTDEPPITVKGFAEPMRSHLVQRVRPRSLGITGRGLEGLSSPMVGRDTELARLNEGFETVLEEGALQLITVCGDPGLGKSRLLLEFERWLEDRHPAASRLHARAQPYSNSVPYGLLRDLLARHFGILDSDAQALAQTKLVEGFGARFDKSQREASNELAAATGRLMGLDYGTHAVVTALEGDGRQMRDRAFHGITTYLRRLRQQTREPVVLMLDDLHWADDGSLDFIAHLARTCEGDALLLLCVTRPELFERRPLWGSGRENHARIDLQRLTKRNSRQLVDALLAPLGTIPTPLRDLLTTSAEGNPYFVEELIGMLIDDGAIVQTADHWEVSAERLMQIRVPSTLAGVLQARLATLPPMELATLRRASVVGHVFWDEALQAAAPLPSETLSRLMQRELAYGRDTSTFEGTREYVFKHHLLHKVTYDGVLKRDKREQHRLTAKWLVTRTGERASEHHALIADHFEKAGDRDRAVEYLRKAGVDALDAYAIEVALSHFERALLLITDPATRFDVLRQKMLTLFRTRPGPNHDHTMAEMAAMAETLEDDGRRALVASFQATVTAALGDLAATATAAQAALRYAELSGNTAAAIRAHNQWGDILARAGELDAAQHHLGHGLVLSRSTSNWMGEASALSRLAMLADMRGRYSEARGHFRAAIHLATSNGDKLYATWLECLLATTDNSVGHHDAARNILLSGLNAFRAVRSQVTQAHLMRTLAQFAQLTGEAREAARWLDEARAVDPGNQEPDVAAWEGKLSGDVHAALGDTAEARAGYERAVEACLAMHRPRAAMAPRAGLAHLALSTGDWEVAREQLEPVVREALAGTSLCQLTDDAPWLLFTCHEVLSALGDARAVEFLGRAHSLLHERAAELEEEERNLYLVKVPLNRRIVEMWQRHGA